MKIEIKCKFSGKVLFEHDEEVNSIRITLEVAVKAGANLAGAYLARAYLDGANLAGANLAGAYLAGGEKLVGDRPILQIGPIGSRCAYLVVFLTDKGIRLRTGCFFGSREEFESNLAKTHAKTTYAEEYLAALAFIDIHAKLWMPTQEKKEAA